MAPRPPTAGTLPMEDNVTAMSFMGGGGWRGGETGAALLLWRGCAQYAVGRACLLCWENIRYIYGVLNCNGPFGGFFARLVC